MIIDLTRLRVPPRPMNERTLKMLNEHLRQFLVQYGTAAKKPAFVEWAKNADDVQLMGVAHLGFSEILCLQTMCGETLTGWAFTTRTEEQP